MRPPEAISVTSHRRRVQLSCDQCRVAKRKCSRTNPCNRCTSLDDECTFDRARQTKLALRSQRERGKQRIEVLTPSETTTSSPTSISSSTQQHNPEQTSHLNTPNSSILATCDVLRSNDSNRTTIDTIIAEPKLLYPLLDVYFRELESMTDFLNGTRIHRLMKLDLHTPLLQQCPDSLQPAMRLLILVMILLISQMHSVQVEATLLSAGLCSLATSASLEKAAYSEIKRSLEELAVNVRPADWHEECFAACYLLRMYEKFSGHVRACKEGILLDAARLQQAGLHRFPRQPHSPSRRSSKSTATGTIWPEEAALLGYRVFWAYFDKDRTTAWLWGAGYSLHVRHSNICLRDPFGHVQVNQLATTAETSTTVTSCTCTGQQVLTTLSAYAGANARLGAIIGRFFDRMSILHSPTCQWPSDAERLLGDLESELSNLESMIASWHKLHPNEISIQQKDLISLVVAHIRSDGALYTCDAFANVLEAQGRSDDVVSWMMTRRRLDTADRLLVFASEMSSRAAMHPPSMILLPKFIREQVVQLIDDLTPWFKLSGDASSPPRLAYLDSAAQDYLLSRLQSALTGRNLLVLLTRHSTMESFESISFNLNNQLSILLQPFLSEIDTNTITNHHLFVNQSSLIKAVEVYLEAHQRSMLRYLPGSTDETTTLNPNMDMLAYVATGQDIQPELNLSTLNSDLTSLFGDYPTLEHLLWPTGLEII